MHYLCVTESAAHELQMSLNAIGDSYGLIQGYSLND